jgi:hypothetical protein
MHLMAALARRLAAGRALRLLAKCASMLRIKSIRAKRISMGADYQRGFISTRL